mgnify:CR=1 FL=1
MNTHTALGALGLIRPEDIRLALARDALTAGHRKRTWEIEGTYHCSIIGTCLTTTDVRHLLRKLKDPEAGRADEHSLHVKAVRLAGRSDVGGKLLNKALDKKHEIRVRRFAKAGTAVELRQLWDEANADADIPAGYWATISHPLCDRPLAKDVFGAIHMLSHLVGRSSRTDVRRIRSLEDQVEIRDARIENLEGRVRRLTIDAVQLSQAAKSAESEASRARAVVATRTAGFAEPDGNQDDSGLEAERRHRRELAALQQRLQATEAARDALAGELAVIETLLGKDEEGDEAENVDLEGAVLLYVGGRPGLRERLRGIVAGFGGLFEEHDGGVEHARSLLPGLIARAHAVVFPVDCVSHWAMDQVKRLCVAQECPFFALRSASITALLATLPQIKDSLQD